MGPGDSWLAFHWTPEWQRFGRGLEETYTNRGPTTTSPSHDVAHLILAAGSRLPWLRIAPDENLRLAEFNAVFLEHLCVKAMQGEPYERAVEHARWFVTEYYSPFPIPFDRALELFKNGIDVESVLRLSPVFFNQRFHEQRTADFLERQHGARFLATFAPEISHVVAPAVTELARAIACLLEP